MEKGVATIAIGRWLNASLITGNWDDLKEKG